MSRPRAIVLLRTVAVVAVGVALGVAVWLQRNTVVAAFDELGAMPPVVVGVMVGVAAVERILRADVVRRLLGSISLGRAFTIHDVGAATSKGVPFGGALSTALRWSIARDALVPTPTFVAMLVAYGVAATFMTWLFPLGVIAVEATRRPTSPTDLLVAGLCLVVVGGSAVFWAVVLGSERITEWTVARLRRGRDRAARRVPAVGRHDPGAALVTVRTSLRSVATRPVGLLVRVAAAQACGAVILLLALRGLGVGDQLGTLEFARVYFVVTLLSSFAPVPGGVGVVEAGLTGALVAAGVDSATALAGVLVYRLLTYVAPIVIGAALYVAWRARRRAAPAVNAHDPVGPSPIPVSPLS